MKRVILSAIIALCSFTVTFAQQTDKELTKEEAKAQKQKEKEMKKQLAEAQELAEFNAAVAALEKGAFVLEADRVEFKRGTFVNVISTTNFVMQEDNKATVQLAFPGAAIGPNGVGGLTVEGDVSNAEVTRDKKGNVHYRCNVIGTGLSATVTISMPNGTNYCTATVTPNFNSNRTSFTGHLKPKALSSIFKGMAL